MNTPLGPAEARLRASIPLPILFSHKCGPAAHDLYDELRPLFAAHDQRLARDPFDEGADPKVSMKRLPIHGLVFHCTRDSVRSPPCRLELATAARRLDVPIMVITDGEAPTSDLKKRLYVSLPALANEARPTAFRHLAEQMLVRARLHTIIEWLRNGNLAVAEREDGCQWLCRQSPQALAEFLGPIAALQRGASEDNILCRLLATILGLTGLPEAGPYLRAWLPLTGHP